MQTKFSPLHLYKSSFQRQVTTLKSKISPLPVYIKVTKNAFWWGATQNLPSLNSHENGVLAGYFFKNSKYIYKYPSQLIALGAIKT